MTAGLRYTGANKHDVQEGYFANAVGGGLVGAPPMSEPVFYHAVNMSSKAGLDFEVAKQSSPYASVSTAYKSGGASALVMPLYLDPNSGSPFSPTLRLFSSQTYSSRLRSGR